MNSVTKFFPTPSMIGLFSFGALILSSLPAMARPATVLTHANIRSGASINAPVRETLSPNGAVEILNIARGTDGRNWYYVRSEIEGTEEGWVRSDLVAFQQNNRQYAVLRGNPGDRTNVRSSPTTASNILHYGIAGDVVEVGRLEREDNYFWYWVTFPNQASGWVRGDRFNRID
ncbi:MAG: SH3 domain-containing protein [Leptolyngbyaceae cyanobacterium CSU_1_3]|nr:SH3 domain-containing protein [Leptolyngbyaceae cyanobacterium CSU_1_3]